jgi:hypothetical protein
MITLDLNTKGFSLINALACAQVSEMAYDPPAIGVQRVDTELAHAIIIESDVARAVGFRGTDCPVDFITDAKCWRKCLGDGVEIHAGFDDGVNSIYNKLVSALVNLPPKPTFFLGHSYGGAGAVRFADLWDQRRQLRGEVDIIAGVYTVGQPRIYNQTGASKYDARLGSRTFRIVYEEDAVARVPLYPPPIICHLHSPYWHCGEEVFLPVTGGCILGPSLRQLLISDVLGLYSAYRRQGVLGLIDDPLADHAVAKNYLGRLQEEANAVDLSSPAVLATNS